MTIEVILPRANYATFLQFYINGERRTDIQEFGQQSGMENMPISGVFKNHGEWIDDENVLHFIARDIPDEMVEIKDGCLTIVHTADEIEELNTEDLFI